MRLTVFFLLLLPLLSISQTNPVDQTGLKDYYADYFPIGVSVSPRSFVAPDSALIIREFNSLTAENFMKMGPIHPKEDLFNWTWPDKMIAFAQAHGMKARGHTLCWHNQTPDWMFVDENGKEVSKKVLLQRLKAHIHAVAGRYKGQIYAWDVVNEVISDSPDEFFRPSKWHEICGEDFIYKAFQYAHEADPEALLFYNDYSTTNPKKRDKIVALIKKMQAMDIPIHGMGMQAHWSIYGPPEQEIRDAMDAYRNLGLQLQITELDLSVYRPESGRRTKKPDEQDAFTPEIEKQQIARYQMIFQIFRDYKAAISGITFWNVTDRHSWLDNFPVRGRKNYPLLFDQNGKRKKAYDAVINFVGAPANESN